MTLYPIHSPSVNSAQILLSMGLTDDTTMTTSYVRAEESVLQDYEDVDSSQYATVQDDLSRVRLLQNNQMHKYMHSCNRLLHRCRERRSMSTTFLKDQIIQSLNF